METWLLLGLGALTLMIIADIIRVSEGSNRFSAIIWIVSFILIYKAWDVSPWRHTHPAISLILFFLAYMVIGFGLAAFLWSRRR